MLRTVLLGRTGVILAMPTPPFTPDDISQTFEDLAAGHRPGMDLSTPIIVDARGAPLLNDGQMGIGQVVLRRKFLQRRQPAAPLVTVVPNLKEFGNARVFNIMMHVSKIRDENLTYISQTWSEGLQAMARFLAPDGPSAKVLADETGHARAQLLLSPGDS